MIRVAYGILKQMPKWEDIPKADRIGETFGKRGGISLAFMNLSKASNQSGDSAAERKLIKKAFHLSTEPRNFIKDEIAILKPDIIIAMNPGAIVGNKLDSIGKWTEIQALENASAFWLDSSRHRSLFIDTLHFSARGKSAEKCFYIPICNAIRRSVSGRAKPASRGRVKTGH